MEIQNNLPIRISGTSFSEQYRRQHLSSDWRPQGMERFTYISLLQDSMPVMEGDTSALYGNPDRYKPVAGNLEAFPSSTSENKRKKKER